MEDELQFHLEMRTRQLVDTGLPEDEARRQARIDFGGLEQVREDCREVLGVRLMHDMLQDLRYAIRVLARSRGFTIVTVLTLALGIGANTAVFSVINTLILQPLPFDEPDRIVMMWQNNPETTFDKEQVAWGDLADWKAKNTSFESMGYVVNRMSYSRSFLMKFGEDISRVRGCHASSGLFEVLGVAPLLGTTFTSEDDQPGGARHAVLSQSLWVQAFASDPQVIGRSIDVGHEEPYQVVGVMPRTFRFPQDADVWFSVAGWERPSLLQRTFDRRDQHGLWVVGRLRPGIAAEEASADLNTIQRQIYEAPENRNVPRLASEVDVVPLLDQVNGSETRPALLLLFGAVGLVLLIACANVANLLLARAMARRREMAIRASLGAGRSRVIRQLLTESLLLALVGAGVAVLFANWGIRVLSQIRADATYLGVKEFRFDRYGNVELDLGVFAFTVGLSVATGLLFGLIPAVQAARLNVNSALKEDSRSGTPGRGTRFLRNSLLVSEVALAMVLLTAATLVLRGFAEMLRIDPGLAPEHVLRAELDLAMANQVYGLDPYESFDEVIRRLEALPGVVQVSGCGEIPLVKSGWQESFQIVGPEHDNLDPAEIPMADLRLTSPGVFETLGVPLLAGRDFEGTIDTRENPAVAIVNQAFAERFFPDGQAVGRKIRMRGIPEWEREIVGVVGTVRNYSSGSFDQHEVYMPFQQWFMDGSRVGPVMVMQVQGDPMEMVAAIRSALDGADPKQQVLIRFQDLESVLDMSASHQRFQAILLGSFAGVALLLAVVGVYGVMAYSTSQRTQEIGIRLALGAQPGQILRTIVSQGVVLCGLGIAIGIAAAFVLQRVMANLVYGVTGIDAATLAGVALMLLLVGVAASLIPARRAMRIDPMLALRHE